MRKLAFLTVLIAACGAQAAWYWPFGEDEPEPPRLSELMETASRSIDEAADFAADGKIDEAVAAYRKALAELRKVEKENPERAATPEFATVRNKRAYVSAAIDSLLMAQARENAKAVAVTDTRDLEKRLAAKRAGSPASRAAAPAARPKLENQLADYMTADRAHVAAVEREARNARSEKEAQRAIAERLAKNPADATARVMQAGEAFRKGDVQTAKSLLAGVLAEKSTFAPALNMRAVIEATQGDPAAEKTLELAIRANPRDFHGYYNMAMLLLQTRGDKEAARRYYETGRTVGGPKDDSLEEALK
jgi:tetratricopeptide (TPR) repeat protein